MDDFEQMTQGWDIELSPPFDPRSLSNDEILTILAETEAALADRDELTTVRTETARQLHAKRGTLLLEKAARRI